MDRSINNDYKETSFTELENRDSFINFFYTDPKDINDEILMRRAEIKNDPVSVYNLDEKLKHQDKIIGIIHRDITPNMEICRMIDTCDFLSLHPVLFDNVSDKFSCKSKSKYYLGRMAFFSGFGKNGGMKVDYHKVIDFVGSEGKRQNDVVSLFGDNLMDFHKKLFNEKYHFLSKDEFDVEEISGQESPLEIYKFLFRLSIIRGVMLDHFSFKNDEIKFIEEVVYPSFISVWNETGYKPILVPFEPTEMDDEDFWYYYFANIKDIIESIYNKKL